MRRWLMNVLGIETSCDETSAAVVRSGWDVRSNIVSSQEQLHARYGGVVPELASRAHVEQVDLIVERALHEARIGYDDLDAIAVSDGPGLVGSLLVGVAAAKTLALILEKPLLAVDHIAAHATSAALAQADAPWPAVSLVVSGGHTSLYLVRDFLDMELLGQTQDDAAGEAFDKIAAILNLGFPGGAAVDRLAREGNPRAHQFPRTWIHADHLNFSFSGIKTAVLYHVNGVGNKYGDIAKWSRAALADVAASFQAAVVDVLVAKTIAAAAGAKVKTVTVGGGVAANSMLRLRMQQECEKAGLTLILTPLEYCTDNAAMIASLGYHLASVGRFASLALEPRSGLQRPGK